MSAVTGNYSFLGTEMASKVASRKETQAMTEPITDVGPGTAPKVSDTHPAGRIRHGGGTQILRLLSVILYLVICCCTISATQFLGAPLYLINQDYYYAYMSLTKQSFGLFITTLCQWWSPTIIRVSWDTSVKGQLRRTSDGRLECDFPERIVLIANHQLYTDWLYLWWIAYTNRMHGHIFIILKESLKHIPIIGWGMQFFSFIFLARNWQKDKARFRHRLQKLSTRHSGPMSGTTSLDPMWLLMFPEGTNLSNNGRNSSAKWAGKQGYSDMKHQLIPRSTGLLYCLQELQGTVDWVYDCTVAYEGIPRGQYGQDIFTLRSSMIQGRPPKSVNMYWRRFAMSSIPVNDSQAFDIWLRERWREKDELLEYHMQVGRFPADEVTPGSKASVFYDEKEAGYIETEVRQAHWWEFTQIFVGLATVGLVGNVLFRLWKMFSGVWWSISQH